MSISNIFSSSGSVECLKKSYFLRILTFNKNIEENVHSFRAVREPNTETRDHCHDQSPGYDSVTRRRTTSSVANRSINSCNKRFFISITFMFYYFLPIYLVILIQYTSYWPYLSFLSYVTYSISILWPSI